MSGQSASSRNGMTIKLYRGDRTTLMAFDLADGHPDLPRLAGFAVKVKPPRGKEEYIPNRLSFSTAYTSKTTAADRVWTPSNEAPFQKFRWGHYPSQPAEGVYRYTATAMLFTGKGSAAAPRLEEGPSVSADIDLLDDGHDKFTLAFTRGYLSSQAYAERFKNADIRPKGEKSADFSTAPFRAQYEWLGSHAREALFETIQMAVKDKAVTVDAFTYDLDEPDVIGALASLGRRLRVYQDNSASHVSAKAVEPAVVGRLRAAGAEVKIGHFQRFQHNKVLILKRNGTAFRVLAGSANFSVRGLYVQANNVFVFDAPDVAALYARAFDSAWGDIKHNDPASTADFKKSPIARAAFPIDAAGVPPGTVAFSPHADASVSLGPAIKAVRGASSSVLFAVMEMKGGGDLLTALRAVSKRADVFSFGVTQRTSDSSRAAGDGLTVVSSSTPSGLLVPFAALDKNVPRPFRKEWSGGSGQVIHHKFVVVDFNDTDPVVFAGSSNLADGGEKSNGDNLVMFRDRGIVTAYAVEAIRLVDHYSFRAAMKKATSVKPLGLRTRDDANPWWKAYYDPKQRKRFERRLLSS